jgi:hypothetical protein
MILFDAAAARKLEKRRDNAIIKKELKRILKHLKRELKENSYYRGQTLIITKLKSTSLEVLSRKLEELGFIIENADDVIYLSWEDPLN